MLSLVLSLLASRAPKQVTLCLCALILSTVLPCISSADLFYKVEKVIKLTDLNPAADGTVPFSVTGLNDAGRMTGYFPATTGNKLHAFVWDNASKVFIDLNDQLAADSSMATCINNNGTVAGIFWELGTYAQKGFVYYSDGTISTFSSPDGLGGPITGVTALNLRDDLIGTYGTSNGVARGFIIEQQVNSGTITDLGDLGQTGFDQYVWPNALNDFDQVVGDEYLLSNNAGGGWTSYTRGFFWDAGMTLIDASDLSSNWTAVSLNNNGQVVGLYGKSSVVNAPFLRAGSYYWDPNIGDMDLGDLGGGSGASVFALTDDSVALGTSMSSDGTLHLFNSNIGVWNTAQTDMGSVSLYDGDTSFSPMSLNSTVVKSKPTSGSGNNIIYSIAGFGTDASGNTLSLLWMNNSIYSVADLVPAYLSFTTISHAYGSMVLINSMGQIACAGTDAAGNQMGLLLSVDPDTDNDGLPDSWEVQYYGPNYRQLGINKYDPVAAGGGLTNWQAYQQGVNPNDFYDGKPPLISVVSGDNQEAAPNSFVPLPLIVQVSNATNVPAANAAVKFTVSGEGQLQRTNVASPKPVVSIVTDANGQAEVFFQVSDHPHTASQIFAEVAIGNSTTKTKFDETSNGGETDPNPTPTDPNDPIDPDDPNNPPDVPAQSYACVDVSSDATTADINSVALSDDNRVTFGFYCGAPIDLVTDYSQFQVYTWQAGTLNQLATLDVAQHDFTDGDDDYWKITDFFGVTSAGIAYGNVTEWFTENGILWPAGWCGMYGCADLPDPPYNSSMSGLGYLSNSGYAIGSGDGKLQTDSSVKDPWVFYAFIKSPDNKFLVFPDTPKLLIDAAGVAGKVTVVNTVFQPGAVNSRGQAVGSNSGSTASMFWGGSGAPYVIGIGMPTGLNEQGQTISKVDNGEGYMWESGQTTILANHLPISLRGKISNIQPFSISNQTALGTDATIYILATATVNGVANTTIVCSRDDDGDWSFAQVGVPAGSTISQYSTINSKGIIVGTGNTGIGGSRTSVVNGEGTGNNQALLLPPLQITLKPQGDTEPPEDGVLVKKGDTVQMALNPGLLDGTIPLGSYPLQTSQVNWQYRQLNGDGTFTTWTDFQANPEGPEFDYTTTTSGIFQVQAVIMVNGVSQTIAYVRKRTDRYGADSKNAANSIYAQGQPDYFGVADNQWQINVRNQAVKQLGSVSWGNASTMPPITPGAPAFTANKCNIFVFWMCNLGGARVPTRDFNSRFHGTYQVPPLPQDWYNGESFITGWTLLGTPQNPQPGEVVSRSDPTPAGQRATGGHVGILDYDGAWINAGSVTVNRYPNVTPPGNPYNDPGNNAPERCSTYIGH